MHRTSSVPLCLARRYEHELGLRGAPRASLHVHRWPCPRDEQPWRWTEATWPPTPHTYATAIAGRYGLAVRGLATVSLIVIDIDCHDAPRRPPAIDDIDEFLAPSRAGRAASRARQCASRARRARPIIRKLRALYPGVTWIVHTTPRGLHAVARIAPTPAPVAAALGQRIIEQLGSPRSVESFPRLEGATAALCRLPITGPANRMVTRGLTRPAHRLRADDVRALLAAPVATLAEFSHPDGPVVASPAPAPHQPPVSRPAPARAGEDPRDADLRATLAEHLRGSDYAAAVLAVIDHGIPDDASFDTARKVAFAAVAAGLSDAASRDAFRALIARPHHRATHCATGRPHRRGQGFSCSG